VLDAKALLDAGRWSGAYYLAGYAMECGLKACVLAFVERTGELFRDKEFSKKCFTHNISELIVVAQLLDSHNDLLKTNLYFRSRWTIAKRLTEASRYQQQTESEARALYEAITDDPDGILPWIRTHW
jgi:hypothetical protein